MKYQLTDIRDLHFFLSKNSDNYPLAGQTEAHGEDQLIAQLTYSVDVNSYYHLFVVYGSQFGELLIQWFSEKQDFERCLIIKRDLEYTLRNMLDFENESKNIRDIFIESFAKKEFTISPLWKAKFGIDAHATPIRNADILKWIFEEPTLTLSKASIMKRVSEMIGKTSWATAQVEKESPFIVIIIL